MNEQQSRPEWTDDKDIAREVAGEMDEIMTKAARVDSFAARKKALLEGREDNAAGHLREVTEEEVEINELERDAKNLRRDAEVAGEETGSKLIKERQEADIAEAREKISLIESEAKYEQPDPDRDDPEDREYLDPNAA